MLLWAVILVAFLAISPQPAFAKNDPNAPKPKVEKNQPIPDEQIKQRIDEHIQQLNEKLNLTKKQKKAVRRVLENEAKEIQALRSDQSPSTSPKNEKIQSLRQNTNDKINKILTLDQQKKFAQLKEQTQADILQKLTSQQLDRLDKELNLTEDQKNTIGPILENNLKELRAVIDSNSLTDAQKPEKIKAVHQLTKEQINKILTPDQHAKFAQAKEHLRQTPEQRINNRIDRLTEELNLTEKQKKAIRSIFENETKELAAVFNDNSLTREQKFTKTSTVRKATREQLNKILTPQQQVKFEQTKDKAAERRAQPGRIRPSAPHDSNL